ncbi:hypothetical protein GLS40_02415 [Pseudooceanicola sp. 216_PA32_1]|uniref:Endonuclease/exonuclease/phosphatase domain-containing protein n=1 Tax=Pseudooceanicola pacificus TaxID=2676438 RepID=A0A844W199_9RHOB|nr:endonuclease/exonuclease/phosphatase family protein [Pseudooceanicola pacificus]MWB76875.1 hypothetical protein [Pseudooceanicola pacificus]
MIRMASYNIQYGKGKDDLFDLPRIVGELGEQDLIALQEVERNCPRSGHVDQPEEIAALLPDHYWVFCPGVDAHSPSNDPKARHTRWEYGNMVLSRWPILTCTNHVLPRLALVNQFHQQRALIETVIATPEGPLRFCSVHLDHVSTDTRMPQVELMEGLLHSHAIRGSGYGGAPDFSWAPMDPPEMPADMVVMGDMNFSPAGAEYTRLFGDIAGSLGRTNRAGGFADAFVAAGHAEDAFPTIDAARIGQVKIDHCFLSARLAPFVRSASVDADAVGSDHQPIFVSLDLAAAQA